MAKKSIKKIVEEILSGFLEEEGYELYDLNFVKEGKDWFLKVTIDRLGGGNEGIGTEDCEKVSRYLSVRLDEVDPVSQNYYLEVSSPGMDRELIKKEHFERNIGKLVEVSLYKALDGNKAITGELCGYKDGDVTLKMENGESIELSGEQVAKTKLAVVF